MVKKSDLWLNDNEWYQAFWTTRPPHLHLAGLIIINDILCWLAGETDTGMIALKQNDTKHEAMCFQRIRFVTINQFLHAKDLGALFVFSSFPFWFLGIKMHWLWNASGMWCLIVVPSWQASNQIWAKDKLLLQHKRGVVHSQPRFPRKQEPFFSLSYDPPKWAEHLLGNSCLRFSKF